MTNLKNKATKTVAMKAQSFKGWSILLALVLVATTAGAALAYNSDAKGHTFDSTFIKWVTTWPPPANMVGVVDGDVGLGTYAGEVISAIPAGDNITSIEAIYHFNGSKHTFTAELNIEQNDLTGTATITGFVTEGWLKGASVTGGYNVVADCSDIIDDTPGNVFGNVCFQGVLHVHVPK